MAATEKSDVDLVRILWNTDPMSVKPQTWHEIRDEGMNKVKEATAKKHSVRSVPEALAEIERAKSGYAEVSFFLDRCPEKSTCVSPQLSPVPKKFHRNGTQSKKLRKQGEKLIEVAYEDVGRHLFGNIERKGLLNDALCSGCTGNCYVQRLPLSSIEFTNVPDEVLIVPCISEQTKKLPRFEIRTFDFVSICLLICVQVFRLTVKILTTAFFHVQNGISLKIVNIGGGVPCPAICAVRAARYFHRLFSNTKLEFFGPEGNDLFRNGVFELVRGSYPRNLRFLLVKEFLSKKVSSASLEYNVYRRKNMARE